MNPEPSREETLFDAARQLSDANQQAAFLDQACAGDAGLRRRVEQLLAAQGQVDAFFDAGLPDTPSGGGPSAVPTDMEPEATPREGIGEKIERYKLLEKLGEGGFGAVWVAEQREPVRRRVALKIIKLGMDTRQVVARFEAERQALAMMDHPNIAKVLDAGATDTGRPYFVMELVKGIPITKYCEQEGLETQARLDLFIQVAHAIQHAHQKGIIHRDIKPSNILVTLHDGVPVPKVIDFGIAKATQAALTEKTIYTQYSQFIGTPAYMSPEQAEMSGLDIDTRSDVYSLGVLLYELLTGATPFDTKELMKSGLDEMRRIIREQEPARPSTRLTQQKAVSKSQITNRKSQIANDLDWIVMKCLEKDRTRRYETANSLALDLKRHLENEPVVARPPSTVYRLQKVWRRNRLAVCATAAVAVALILGTCVSLWQAAKATQASTAARMAQAAEKEQRAAAERNLYAADMNLTFQAVEDNRIGRAADLLNRHIPEPGMPDLRGWEWHYLWRMTRGDELLTLSQHTNTILALAYSPNGTVLASGSWDETLRLWSRPSHQLITNVQYGVRVSSLAFNSTGELLAAAGGEPAGKVTLWRTKPFEFYDRFEVRIDDVWFKNRGAVTFTPDDRFLLVGQHNGEILFRDVQRRTNLFSWVAHPDTRSINALALSADRRLLASGGHGSFVKIWELPDQEAVPKQKEAFRILDLEFSPSGQRQQVAPVLYDSTILDLQFSPSGNLLAGCGYNMDIRIWDVDTGEVVKDLTNHTGWVGAIGFSTDGKILFSASGDQSIRIWDTATWEEIGFLKGHLNEVWSLAVSSDGQQMATGGKDHLVKIWDTQSRGSSAHVKTISDGFRPDGFRRDLDVVFSMDSRTFLIIHDDDTVKLWNSNGLEQIADLTDLTMEVSKKLKDNIELAGDLLATRQEDGSVKVWNYRTKQTFQVLPQAGKFKLSADGNLLAYSTGDRHVVRVMKIRSGEDLGILKLERPQRPFLFSPDGRRLLCSSRGGTILWDLKTLDSTVFKRYDESGGFAATKFSPDGKSLAVVGDTGYINLFSITDSGVELSWEVNPHLQALFSVCFSPEGDRLAVSSSTGNVWLCDATTGQEIGTLKVPKGMGGKLNFSSNGNNLLVFATGRGPLQIYSINPLRSHR